MSKLGQKYLNRKRPIPFTKEHKEKIGKNNARYWTGKSLSKETREKISQSRRGKLLKEKNPSWKGDEVGYSGLHVWIRKELGSANKCENPECKYPRIVNKKYTTKASGYEWANKSGKYKRDVNDFIQLCTSCHKKYDNSKRKSYVSFLEERIKELEVKLDKLT